MPKASVLQSNFSAGELSPLLAGRTEAPKYKQGLAVCQNYIPTLQGPLARRPGTKFLTAVKDSTKPPILVPFEFSVSQSYVLEFGDQYIQFYANNGQIITTGTDYALFGTTGLGNTGGALPGVFYAIRPNKNPHFGEVINTSTPITPGNPVTVVTPYAYSDLSLLRWAQSGNILYLFHPKYPVYKLQRFGQEDWTLKQVIFRDGPYLPLNSVLTTGDSTTVTLTTDGLGQFSSVLSSGPTANISAAANDGTGQILITTASAHGYSSGQSIFIKLVTGTTEANNNVPGGASSTPMSWTISVSSSTSFVLEGSTFVNAYISGGVAAPAIFINNTSSQLGTPSDVGRNISVIVSGVRYWGLILAVPNAATASVYGPPDRTFPVSATATAWQLGVFGYINGFPSCGTFHQDRLGLSGCPNYGQEVDLSSTGDYENFAPSAASNLAVTSDNALQFTLNSKELNTVNWLASTAQGLLAGSASAEWAMTPSTSSDALTPTNFNAQQTSFYGSSAADAVTSGNAVLYIQRAQRKLRELNFFFQVGTFRSTDMTELSEHITLPSITKLVVQKETQPLIWALRSDGALLSMVYNRDDVSIQAGWTRHTLGGQSDSSGSAPIVQSIAIIPSPDQSFDQLWMTVKRYINGQSVVCIEYMTKIFDDLALQEDAFQCDCGGTYDAPVTITGISTANPAVVTAASHGFSNGQRIRLVGVIGMGKATTDINGNVTHANLVNEATFITAGVTTNTFQLNDYNGNPVSSTAYGAYISGGQVRKMVTTISGLTWLENETVSVLADGGLHPDVTVSNSGSISLAFPAAKVQIGYKYNSDLQLMRAEAGSADGTSIGKTRRTTRAAIQMHNVGQISMGTSFSNLIPLEFPRADSQPADQATPLYSGIMRDGVESAYDFESQLCVRQNSMLPGFIQSITTFMEEQDV